MQYVVLTDLTYFDKYHGGEQGLALLQYRKSLLRTNFSTLNSPNKIQALANFSVNYLENFGYVLDVPNSNKDFCQRVKIAEEIYFRLSNLYPEILFSAERAPMEAYQFSDKIEYLLNNSFKLYYTFLPSTIEEFFTKFIK